MSSSEMDKKDFIEYSYTVIIPCRNEEKYIGLCLDSIVNLDYPKDKLTVIVSDGKSTDNTRLIIEDYSKKHAFIQFHLNEKQSAPYAFNYGIENAKSDVLIILGAHSEVDSQYLKECNKAFCKSTEIGCVGGVLTNVFFDEDSKAIGAAMSSGFGVGNASFRTGDFEGYVDTVAFGAYKIGVFETIGNFDISLTRNQDDELNYRLTSGGFKIWLSKSIKSKYYVRASFSKLWKQYYQYGYWKVYVNKKHKTITTVRQLIPFLFVMFLIASGISALIIKETLFLSIPILMLYILLAFYSSFKAEKVNNFKVVYSFLILHLSYGKGYLDGIIRFIIFNKQPSIKNEQLSR